MVLTEELIYSIKVSSRNCELFLLKRNVIKILIDFYKKL
jgi:hypothetical protein